MVGQMNTAPAAKPAKLDASLDYDVIIIGGGQSGMYSLHRMRQLGLKTRLFEAGSGEGGTWFW
jgi:cation diffusion facilitator CzcD-associated flavoprotein CzcO